VFVRYYATNIGDLAATCTLNESSTVIQPGNSVVLPAGGAIAIDAEVGPVTPGGAPICNADLTAQEPDTARLSCQCPRATGGPLSDVAFDIATIACEVGGDGCTPGFWKQPHHLQYWVGYAPTDLYDTVFGVTSTFAANTLLEVLSQGGGGEIALGRNAVAALLNSTHGDVDFAFDTATVIQKVQDAYASGDFSTAHRELAAENERGCTVRKSNTGGKNSSGR